MRIRPYRANDFEATVSMWRAVSLATYTFLAPHIEAEDRAYFRGVILKENAVWVAEGEEGAPSMVGFLALQGDLVDRLYVHLEHQGRGVGSALLEQALVQSPSGLRLFTHQKNVGACRFYERRGFTVLRRGVSPPPESEPDVEYGYVPS
jgi:ribosomal protein S18 acetylase RimI-like enzyme